MEQTVKPDIVEQFYKEYLNELNKELRVIGLELELFGEIYLRRINKKDEVYFYVNKIITQLLTDKEGIENDIKRISARGKAGSTMVKWHKTGNIGEGRSSEVSTSNTSGI